MKHKILSLVSLLLILTSASFAETVTVGITNSLSTVSKGASGETLTTADHLTLTQELGKAGTPSLSDSLQAYTTGDKAMYIDKTGNPYYSKKCYRWGLARTEYSPNLYLGYKVEVADGYQMSLSRLDVLMAVGANFTYKVEIQNASGIVLYTTGDYSITNYNNSTTTNASHTLNLSTTSALQNLSGTFYVRAYMYYNREAGAGKYFCFPYLTITGDVEPFYTLPLTADTWASFCPAFDVQIDDPTHLTAYKGTLSATELILTPIGQTTIPARTGVLLKASETDDYVLSAQTATAIADNALLGSTSRSPRNKSVTTYALSTQGGIQQFYQYVGDYIPANKAYIEVASPLSLAPQAFLIIEDQNNTTNAVSPKEENPDGGSGHKFIRHGQLYLLRNGNLYDPLGRKLR